MKLLLFIVSTMLIGHSYGGLILHNIRNNLHTKLYGHGLHGENSNPSSPIININNHQEMAQKSLTQSNHNQGYNQQHESYGFQQSIGGHSRGDPGSLSNYGPHSAYGGNDGFGGEFMNTNIKAGGRKYGYGGALGDYGSHSSMKQESYHHREGAKFGQHHDTNMFGNTKIGTASTATSSSASSFGPITSSASSSTSSSSSSGSSSSAASSSSSSISGLVDNGGGRGNPRVKPWHYSRNHKF